MQRMRGKATNVTITFECPHCRSVQTRNSTAFDVDIYSANEEHSAEVRIEVPCESCGHWVELELG